MKCSLARPIVGRDALPVRAIPYVCGWQQCSPDELARQFAHVVGAPFDRFTGLRAYHLFDGEPMCVKPKEWDSVVARLCAIDAEIRDRQADDDRGYDEWQGLALAALPSGVFVWLDELIPALQADASDPRRAGFRTRDGDTEIVLFPMISDARLALVLEGFEGNGSSVPCLGVWDESGTPRGAEDAENSGARLVCLSVNRKGVRRDVLAPIIDRAIAEAKTDDSASVWNMLVRWAHEKEPSPPLAGFVPEGIQYRGSDYQYGSALDTFTKKNLRDRLRRRTKTRQLAR